jgi:hypothetical protein
VSGAARLAIDGRTSTAGTLQANVSVWLNVSLVPSGGGSNITGSYSLASGSMSCAAPCSNSHTYAISYTTHSFSFTLNPSAGLYTIVFLVTAVVGASETGTGDGWASACVGLGSSVSTCTAGQGTTSLSQIQYP